MGTLKGETRVKAYVLFRILWPLFHYLPGEINFDEAHWEAYQDANMQFAEAVSQIVKVCSHFKFEDYSWKLLGR